MGSSKLVSSNVLKKFTISTDHIQSFPRIPHLLSFYIYPRQHPRGVRPQAPPPHLNSNTPMTLALSLYLFLYPLINPIVRIMLLIESQLKLIPELCFFFLHLTSHFNIIIMISFHCILFPIFWHAFKSFNMSFKSVYTLHTHTLSFLQQGG